jgi:hypothetical protein
MLDNVTFAIFARLSDLAERHGLKPYDFVAAVKDGPPGEIRLDFEVHPTGNARKGQCYDRMLRALGISDQGHTLQAEASQIIDALDQALQRAPRSRA